MNSHHNKNLFANFAALSVVQGTNFLIPLLVMPYVISKVGADGFGIISIAQVCMIYLSVVTDYGFNLTATRDTALHQQDRLKISTIFFTVLATRLMICTFLFVLLLLAIVLLPFFRTHFVLYSLGFSYVIGQTLLVSWFFQGKEKMHYIIISTLVARLIFVVLVFLFIRRKDDAIYFLFFLGAGNIVAGLLSIYLAIRIFKLRFLIPPRAAIVHELKEGWQITISNLSINTYLYCGIFILRIFTNDTIVGYYSIAEKIFFAARQVLAVFSQAIYPHLCRLTQDGKQEVSSFFKKIYLPFLLLIIAGCSLLFVLAPQIAGVFIKDAPALPVTILRMLSFVPVIVCLNIPAYQLLVAFNHKKSYLLILGLATIINIIANVLLAKNLGATGTALSIIITELFITTGLHHQLAKNKLSSYVITGSR